VLRRSLEALSGLLSIAAYPVIIYVLLTHQLAWVGALLVFGLIAWRLRHRAHWPWLLGLLVLGLLLVTRLAGLDAFLKLSPLLIHISLFIIFAQSLRSIPLIERFARLEFGTELPPGIAHYCRGVTWVWVAFFAANIIGCTWLALYGDDKLWVLYNGLIVYGLIVALLLGEYLWRHVRFPDLEIPPPAQTMRSIIANGDQIWGRKSHDPA